MLPYDVESGTGTRGRAVQTLAELRRRDVVEDFGDAFIVKSMGPLDRWSLWVRLTADRAKAECVVDRVASLDECRRAWTERRAA